jgi:serine/threonine protein kinase
MTLNSYFTRFYTQIFFALELKAGGDLEYYLMHMDRTFNEDEVRFFAAEIVLGLKVSLSTVMALHSS